MKRVSSAIALSLALFAACESVAFLDGRATSPSVDRSFGNLPLYFIANHGQTDSRVAYYVQGKEMAVYFTARGQPAR